MSELRGCFVWYELMTSDAGAAEAFYRKVVGWDAREGGMGGQSYTLLSAGGTDVAGLMALPKEACEAGARPGWVGYVAVEDVDVAAARLEAAGGRVHRSPTDIPGVGRFAMVADPGGAAFALFRGEGEAPAEAPQGTPGHIGWRELFAHDAEAALNFYAGLFGWKKGHAHDMGPMGVYQLFSAAKGGGEMGGVMTKPEALPAPFWLYYFNVEAIDAAKGRVEAEGGKVLMGPHEVPGGGWILQALDPQGAMFALLGPRR